MDKLNQSNQSNITPEPQSETSLKPKFPQWGLMLIIIGLLILGAIGYYVYQYYFVSDESIVCTMDAKVCPDGSSVGRIAPDCEFALCPEIDITDWQTYRNEEYGFEVKYPSKARVIEGEKYILLGDINEDGYTLSDGYVLGIEILDNPDRLFAQDWFKKENPNAICVPGGTSHCELAEEEIINNNLFYHVKYWAGDSSDDYFYIVKNDKIINLSYVDYPIENDSRANINRMIYKAMLSTFKFID